MSKTVRAYCIRPLTVAVIRPLTVAIMLIACALATAQKPRLAVVVDMGKLAAGKKLGEGAYKQFSGQVVEFIDEKYAAIDRSADALKTLAKEQEYQRSGAVNDNLIKKLGAQLSADFLCIISITWSIDDYYLEAKLINVETARLKIAHANSPLNSSPELTSAAETIADKLRDAASSKSIGGAGQAISGGSGGGGASPLAHEGKTYKTVKMPDGKIWMAENMNDAAGKSACYQNSEANCQRCGRLYDWATATMICPSGWHLPSDAEWTALTNAAGGSTAGTALKSKSGWSSDGNGMDRHGFSALPCGFRYTDGSFYYYGSHAIFWSATENGSGYAWIRYLDAGDANVYRNNYDKARLFSVRCVRD